MKVIECNTCGNQWETSATSLKARGVFCRDCAKHKRTTRDLSFVSDLTGVKLHTFDEKKEEKDFLTSPSVEELENLEDTTTSIPSLNETTEEIITEDEIDEILHTTKEERFVTKISKKADTAYIDGFKVIDTIFQTFEHYANSRFDKTGYGFRYQDVEQREDLSKLTADILGIKKRVSKAWALVLGLIIYLTPFVRHELTYTKLGERVKLALGRVVKKVKKKPKKAGDVEHGDKATEKTKEKSSNVKA